MKFFNQLTTYRAMLTFLQLLSVCVVIFNRTGLLSFDTKDFLLQVALFGAICWIVNTICARIVKTQANIESPLITGLILALIVGPLSLPEDLLALAVIATVAIVSKYLLVWNKSHIFNPAAFAVFASFFLISTSASWWVGTGTMLYPILIGGVYILRKIRRLHMVVSFFASYMILSLVYGISEYQWVTSDIPNIIKNLVFSPTMLFFAFVMLVEPLTAPHTRTRRIWFGALVGAALFAIQSFAPKVTYSLEMSLLIGNLFAFILNRGFRQRLTLQRKELASPTAINFWFKPTRPFAFTPGQYIEYTLDHPKQDLRGMRRYFSIASAPEEQGILLSTKFAEKSSSYKRALQNMHLGETIIASQLAGDFVMPHDQAKKIAFIAGGIGITPFRSMVKHLLMSGESRDIVLLYAASTDSELAFKEIFEEAHSTFNMKSVYVTDEDTIDAERIKREIPDFKDRIFYISGPEPMVKAMGGTLSHLGVARKAIKRDYFPGYDI